MTASPFDRLEIANFAHVLEEGTFEETLHALQEVVQRLELGGVTIDEAVNLYEVGLALSRRCSDLLEHAELRISAIEEAYGFASHRDSMAGRE